VALAVLDTSVVLAAVNEEPGGDVAAGLIPTALFSSVNLAELVTKLTEKGFDGDEVRTIVDALECEIVPFDAAQALDTGLLRPPTRTQGLSLGDRACLALAPARGLPAYTAERSWMNVAVTCVDAPFGARRISGQALRVIGCCHVSGL
jgi:PIN domain nuclease of toxin-antitoxin system